MNGTSPTQSDLLRAGEGFWQEVRGKLRDDGVPEQAAEQVVETFRNELQGDLEQWAYHDGAVAVAKRLKEHLRNIE